MLQVGLVRSDAEAIERRLDGLDGSQKQGGSKTLEKTLNEEPVQGVRVVAAQSFRLPRRRRVQISMRHVAAASCRPSRPVEHGPSDRRGEQLVAPS